MKKIFLLVLGVALMGFTFADTTGSTTTTNVNSIDIATAKTNLLSSLDGVNSSMVTAMNTLSGSFAADTGYLILQSMGKIDLSTINKSFLNDYFSIKTNITTEYNSLVSAKSLLDEKKSYGLVTDSEYQQQLATINADMSTYYSKYDNIISNFNSTYLGLTGTLTSFSGNLATLRLENSSVISDANSKVVVINQINSGYNQFLDNTSKIKSLYDVNYDNFFAYVKDVKAITTSGFVSTLKKTADGYYAKYVNLSYYSGDINNYIGKLFESFSLDIDTYLNSLIKDFYTQDDYDFITSNYSSFSTKFMTGSKINYSAITSYSIDDVYKTLNTKLTTVNDQIASKFAQLGNPTDLKSVGDSLSQKVTLYYEQVKDARINDLVTYIMKENELLSYKLSQELDSYNVITTRISDVANLTGSSRLASMKSLANDLASFQSGVVDQDLKSKTLKLNAQLQMDIIDETVSVSTYYSARTKYSNIDAQLKTILNSIYADAQTKNKVDMLNTKIDNALSKLDTLLADTSLNSTKKYLLYKIKKAFIWFKYLK